MREGKFYHFQNGSVWPGRGFPEPLAYMVSKNGTITALPCFHWEHDMVCMKGSIKGKEVSIVPDVEGFPDMEAVVSIGGQPAFSIDAKMYPDMAIWPTLSMQDVELAIIDYIQ